ncbi:MAG: hypothetical protein J7L03_07675, partial [Caldisericaceae bacterium]|nr:hypothetical protein [Caldisericaceae bacterium]
MKKKAKKSTGISVTEKFLRIAEIEASEGNITILRLYEFLLPDISNKREIADFGKTIRKLKVRFSGCISPNDKDTILKDKTLPPVRKQEIFKLIESEIKDYAIFNHENVSLGFNVIDKAQDKVTIIWAGLKESSLINLLRFFKHIGIKRRAVIPSNFAIARFIGQFYETSENFVIMNIDDSVTSLTFVKDGKVVLNYKHDLGFRDVVNGTEETKNNWVGNVLTTITFVSRNRKIPIDKIFLVSQQGSPEKLLPFLTARISYPVIIPDLKSLVGFKNEEDFLRVQKTGGSEFIVPIGLALLCGNGLQDPLFCDISKHILVEKASVRLKIITTIILLIIVNGIAVYLYPFFSSILKNLSTNLSNTEKRIEIVSKEAENTEKIKKELSEAKDTLGKYEIVESALKNRVIT